MFSVGSEAEARQLLTFACQTNVNGDFVAEELVAEQTLGNLFEFGERLAGLHERYFRGKRLCECGPGEV